MIKKFKRGVRHLIIGKNVYIESGNEYRQVLLSGHYAIISLIVITVYASIDLANGIKDTIYYFFGAGLLIAFTLFLHRKKLHAAANYLLLPVFNILVFLIVSSEDVATGGCVFFLPVALGAYSLFNYSQRKIAFLFSLASFILCAISVQDFFTLLPHRHYSAEGIKLIQTLNLFIVFPVSFMSIYLLIKLNHVNTSQLIETNKQLDKLNQELDRFVYSTSHDLRAPLLSIIGLLKLEEGAPPEEAEKYRAMMLARIQNLDKFIKDITDYSRNNRLQVIHEPINLYALASEIWESLRYSADALNINFINEIEEDLVVTNDQQRLRVVMSNLISNAIRYHDHRKEKKHIKVSYQVTPTSFQLHIEDNGQGIPAELQTKIFDMFFRGNEGSQGSGLGLYIVKETLDKLSATIHLTSVIRQGSKFSVVVPIRY